MSLFLLLVPDFALILLGGGLRRWSGFPAPFWEGLERLVYFVLFPALLFGAVARTRIDFAATAPLFACGALSMLGGLALGALARPFMGVDGLAFASRVQCAFRFNTYIAIAVAGKLYGASGISLMGVLCGALVPLANLMAVGLLARHGEGRIVRELLRNPLILATLAGLLFNLAGLTLWQPVAQLLARLADASIALGLLAVGSALRRGSPGGHWLGAAWLCAIKLVGLPVIAWLLAPQLGLEGIARTIAVLFAAMPASSSAYILAVRMGGDGPGAAWLISTTTLLSVFTLSGWLSLLR